MTCPMFRQHGARDHTAIWFYGSEDEKILGDIIKLRAGPLKPYIVGELAKLNETGRPFNRPLMWDFPNDPMTWKLAEHGIGDGNGTAPSPDAKLTNGAFVVLSKCAAAAPRQTFKLSGGQVTLADKADSGLCVDEGGAKGGKAPSGPYKVHMWQCSKKFGKMQSWTYDAATKALSGGSGLCLSSAGENMHPTVAKCSAADKAQHWTLTAAGGSIVSSSGECLKVEPAPAGGGGGACSAVQVHKHPCSLW